MSIKKPKPVSGFSKLSKRGKIRWLVENFFTHPEEVARELKSFWYGDPQKQQIFDQFSENFVQAFSHDEVVHGKGSLVNKMGQTEEADRLANLRALLALQWAWPGKKTLFMGCEFGQWKEWDCDAPLDWALLNFPLHAGVSKLVRDLNRLYLSHSSWSDNDHKGDKFRWIDCNDKCNQTLSFLKYGDRPNDTLLVACNFSDQLIHRNWGCPHPGGWKVLLDSDSPDYGGTGCAGATEFSSQPHESNFFPQSLSFSVGRWSIRILGLN